MLIHAHLVVSGKLIAQPLQFRVSRHRLHAVEHVVLAEQVREHSRRTERVDVWRNKNDDRCSTCLRRASMFRDDIRVDFAIGRARGGSKLGWRQEYHCCELVVFSGGLGQDKEHP